MRGEATGKIGTATREVDDPGVFGPHWEPRYAALVIPLNRFSTVQCHMWAIIC